MTVVITVVEKLPVSHHMSRFKREHPVRRLIINHERHSSLLKLFERLFS